MYNEIDFENPIYHGSRVIVDSPSVQKSRTKIDFGQGFYTTQDEQMARNWASHRRNNKAIVSTYKINAPEELNIYRFHLDKAWLQFVACNREVIPGNIDIGDIDIIIGPTADDKMFPTLESYFDGNITAVEALRYLDVAKYSDQIVFKTQKAIDHIEFLEAYQIKDSDRIIYQQDAERIRTDAIRKMAEFQTLDKRGTLDPAPIQIRLTIDREDNDEYEME